ncbi:MAG: polysaccharide deacetylase family protein [Candidatus Coatesbacteria bacterium]|nr:polysaccharide deacetylase family protein [Candidatus Coatesbacteria bacterium]
MKKNIVFIFLISIHLQAWDFSSSALFLCYGDPTSIRAFQYSMEDVRKDFAYLAKNNYKPVSFEEWLKFKKGNNQLPSRNILVIFPFPSSSQLDGYLRLLNEFKFKAIFFVVPEKQIAGQDISISILRKIIKAGHEIGLTSSNYSRYLEIAANEGSEKKDELFKKELKESIDFFNKNAIYFIPVYLYPYGETDGSILGILQNSDIDSAILPGKSLNVWGTNRFYHKYLIRTSGTDFSKTLSEMEKEIEE